MDSKLNEFLNEINEIAPLKNNIKACDWKKCFDEKSGFSYYWNTKTDEVTWEEPKDFISDLTNKNNLPKEIPSYPAPNLLNKVKDAVRIYKLAPSSDSSLSSSTINSNSKRVFKSATKPVIKKIKNQSDSDDEKITLISSYGSESESEDDEKINLNKSPNEDHEEEQDILSNIKKRAECLKTIGQVNSSVVFEDNKKTLSKPKLLNVKNYSLVAGYDSNSEEENEDINSEINDKKPQIEEKKFSHSTLFPIMKPPDINDFISDEGTKPKEEILPKKIPENSLPTKIFQRKRRLGVIYVPPKTNNINDFMQLGEERKGLGFNGNDNSENRLENNTPKNNYSNFTSGGIEFIKPASPKEQNNEINKDNKEKIEDIYELLHEKLLFLCEGNKELMPVQRILIQIETLFEALKADSLKPCYLYDWLKGTSEDLAKLEKETIPEGWLLEWNRSQKRYYYHNQLTGQGQWEYPEPYVNQEEAMDISTTPPPQELIVDVVEQPPLPTSPPIRSPSPPPPPIISRPEKQKLLQPPKAPKITNTDIKNKEPLPPGVDYSESTVFDTKTESNDINSALIDTFYSEIAAIENTSNNPSPSSVEQKSDTIPELVSSEPVKKKKKKVKLGQGLSLKKKDVSKLVEKWKNLQKDY